MAGNPTPQVKANWVAALTPIMPAALSGVGLVPVFYAYPGDDSPGHEIVFMHGSDTVYSNHAMRAGRRRRHLRCSFDAVIQVLIEGITADVVGPNPHKIADERAELLATVLDEHIAENEHLASPTLIDVASLTRSAQVYGIHEHGAWTRITLTVEFDARIL
jgi:hypothetical protein